jgi:hypothetical protein
VISPCITALNAIRSSTRGRPVRCDGRIGIRPRNSSHSSSRTDQLDSSPPTSPEHSYVIRPNVRQTNPRPLPGVAAVRSWTTPWAVDSIEWFASAEDLCRAYVSLSALARRPGLRPIAGALQINDGGLGLDRDRWSSTWFKGGSEPAVLALTYQATTRTGGRYFVSVLASDPNALIDETSAGERLLSAIKGAFSLAAGQAPGG